jgi:signal peptidase I
VTETDFDAFTPPSRPAKRRVSRVLIAMVLIALVGVVVAGFGIFGLIQYRSFTVHPGQSMGDSLKGASSVLTMSPGEGGIHRGDMVVFDVSAFPAPPRENGVVLKRVIGIGGDTVVCCDDQGHLQVNGKSVTEPYLDSSVAAPGAQISFSAKVPEGSVFVAGDLRNNSLDSRFYVDEPGAGAVPLSKVYGVVVATGSVITARPLTPTTAFTDAGLEGAPMADRGYQLDLIMIIAGLVLLLGGIVGMFASLIRSGGRRRLPATSLPPESEARQESL